MAELIQTCSQEDLAQIAELFREYAAWLGIDSCYGHIEKEVADLPGQYGPPEGCLLLAKQDNYIAGCVALRKIDDGICEMKRLHVRPPFRGRGVGRALATAIIAEARRMSYQRMRLDTIADRMKEAVSLYRSLGFQDIEAYNTHPQECTTFMELDLRDQAGHNAPRSSLDPTDKR